MIKVRKLCIINKEDVKTERVKKMKQENEKIMIAKLYAVGYDMKTIAKLVDSVNGHISKVIRSVEDVTGIRPRKKGEKAVLKGLDTQFNADETIELIGYLLNRNEDKTLVEELLGLKITTETISKIDSLKKAI